MVATRIVVVVLYCNDNYANNLTFHSLNLKYIILSNFFVFITPSQLMATELQMQAIQERYNLDVQGVRNENTALTARLNEYEDAVKTVSLPCILLVCFIDRNTIECI